MLGRIIWCTAFVLASSSSVFAQHPIDVSFCDLETNPRSYDRQILRITAKVSYGFEDFTLFDSTCEKHVNGIWLAFGGDVNDDVTYCCGDHSKKPNVDLKVEGIPVEIVKDDLLARFLAFVKAYRRSRHPSRTAEFSKQDYPGSYYQVTATLVGRFFAGLPEKLPAGINYRGFGHLGCCSLFVIQQVESLDNVQSLAETGEVKCQNTFIDVGTKPVNAPSRSFGSDAFFANLIADWQKQLGDGKVGKPLGQCKTAKMGSNRYANCTWISEDDLETFSIGMQKHRGAAAVWQAGGVTRTVCIAE